MEKKFAHLGVSEARRLRQLGDKDSRLKRLVAVLTLDKHMLAEALRNKTLRPTRCRKLAAWFLGTFEVNVARACVLAHFSQAGWYQRSTAEGQSALRRGIKESAHVRQRLGYHRICVLLRWQGWPVNKNRVRGLYRLEGGRCGCGGGAAGSTEPPQPANGSRWHRRRRR